MKITWTSFSTGIGEIFAAAGDGGLLYTSLGNTGKSEMEETLRKKHPCCEFCHIDDESVPISQKETLMETEKQINQYLMGSRKEFDLPVALKGTGFQKEVWEEISRIPYGKTLTYKELAKKIGKPGATRAVGNSCGSNNLPLIIPCHRVIASGGGMGGFGGGIELKKKLLALEQSTLKKLTEIRF